jgi:hypothetical protein
MSTRDRIRCAARAILDAGTAWEDYLASLGTIAQQAQHFDIARATMTKLRNLRKRASEALEEIVAGTASVDEIYQRGTRSDLDAVRKVIYAFCALESDEERRHFFQRTFALRRCSPKTILQLLFDKLTPSERQAWLGWCFDAAAGTSRNDWHASNRRNHACFTTLGLTWPCTEDDIKRAYRQKAHEAHPDKGGTADAFRDLKQAHDDALAFFKSDSRNGSAYA